MTEPRTEAGRTMLRDPMYRFAGGYILAIEEEAAAPAPAGLLREARVDLLAAARAVAHAEEMGLDTTDEYADLIAAAREFAAPAPAGLLREAIDREANSLSMTPATSDYGRAYNDGVNDLRDRLTGRDGVGRAIAATGDSELRAAVKRLRRGENSEFDDGFDAALNAVLHLLDDAATGDSEGPLDVERTGCTINHDHASDDGIHCEEPDR